DPAYTYGPLAGYINNQSMGEYNHRQQTAQMDAFALSIKNNTPVKTPGEEGLRDMLCIEAIYKAARKKKRISLL
ncbi:MAG: gfo/Idh/MocA family oxidoreductase, partial [Calditrichaeota bacterium]|nr:gfo/Idh/MocA family oxidoreductase [Calditrichota bacterium]